MLTMFNFNVMWSNAHTSTINRANSWNKNFWAALYSCTP